MKVQRKFLLPLALIFIICNVFFVAFKAVLTKWGLDDVVLIIANSLFLIINLITLFIQQKALLNTNHNVFIRSVMAGMMIKMFVCIIAIIFYWFIMGPAFSQASVFAGMLLYLIYLAVEVSLVNKLNKQKNA